MSARTCIGEMIMRLSEPRLDPLPDDKWDPELLERYKRDESPLGILNIFRTLANHPALFKRWTVFGNHVLFKSTLGAREREIAILRIGWLCKAEYEWGQHVIIGLRDGLTNAEIERIKDGPDAEGWGELDQAILNATDELHDDAFITDETWQVLSKHYSPQQIMDLVFTVGQYNLVSMALNTLGVQLDDGIDGF